ncbi:LexA family transcriptional repressor [Citrobacter freundii]|uniref:LexA family transcriptional repressor n=2 Tax=Citrobacter freundii TaxID=546 RepID=A0AA44NK60_CITFR|nr:LexA family transcriptional repressor [Citrobacter freundii]OYR03008.1 LexA family transcriptional repressor [Citrobacter freundii]
MFCMDKYEKRRLRLMQIRDEMCGGKAVEVARKIEREPSYVSRMLYDESKKGRKRIADDMVEIIEKAFSLPRGWMDGIADAGHGNVAYSGEHKGAKEFPLISWVSAGQWLEAVEPYKLEEIEEWPETTTHAGANSFWLTVKGDSMTSPVGFTVPDGMIILVDPTKEAKSGKLVVAKLTNDNEATFKMYIEDAGRRFLKPLNPQYPITEINGNCQIIGTVVDVKWQKIP